jgi:WD40 repeat protein
VADDSLPREPPHAADRENPWPGLASFEEGDQDFFKGREKEIDDLLRRIDREDQTLLFGFSGLGKTSLLRAGLFPKLRAAGIFPVYVRLRFPGAAADVSGDPGAIFHKQCFDAIRDAASRWQYEIPSMPASKTMWEYVRREAERFWAPADRLATPLLVFDQFEEAFARDHGPSFEAFLRDLADGISGAAPAWLLSADAKGVGEQGNYLYQPGALKVLLSFREEFLPQVAGLRTLVRAIDCNSTRLASLATEQGLSAVADAGGHLIDDARPHGKEAICRRIIERVAPAATGIAAAVDPALLSLFCRGLNEARKAQGKSVIDEAIVESGAASEIIPKFYEARMRKVSDVTRRFVEERLVLEKSRSRERVSEEAAIQSGARRDDIEYLVRERILRREDSRRGMPIVELTHDVLVEPVLDARRRRAIEEERRREDEERQREEEERQRLIEEEHQREEEERQAQENRERSRRLRRNAGIAVAAAITFAILAVFAGWQWQRAESGQLAARSLMELRSDPELSLRLAIQAVEKADIRTSGDALAETLAQSVIRKRWSFPLDDASDVAFSPSGERVAAGTRAGRVAIWDAATGALVSSDCGPDVVALRWTPGGQILLGLQDRGVELWEPGGASSGRTPLVPGRENGELNDLDIRPDGKEFAIAAGAEGLLRFDLSIEARGGHVSALPKNLPKGLGFAPNSVAGVAYSPDGLRLAVASADQVTLVETSANPKTCTTPPLGTDILRVAFSPRGAGRFGTSSFDYVVRSWPMDCGRPERFIGHRRDVTDLVFLDEGRQLVSVSLDGTIRLWDTANKDDPFIRRTGRYDNAGERVRYQFNRLAVNRSSSVTSAGRTLIATLGAEDGTPPKGMLTVWDIASSEDATRIKGLTGGPPEKRTTTRTLVRLAKDLKIEPALLGDQLPRCR